MAERPIVAVAVTVAGAVFAAAWHHGVWLVVVAMASTAAVLVASELLGERALAHRAAAWALHAPFGRSEAAALERGIAADLATLAVGEASVLDAGVQATDRIADPWLRSLAAERLELARHLVEQRDIPAPPAPLAVLASGRARFASAAACAGFTVAGAATRSPVWIAALVVAVAAFAIGHGEARRRADLSGVLVQAATAPPLRGPLVIPEESVVASLAHLTRSQPRVVARARRLASAAPGPEGRLADARLAAVALPAGSPPPRVLIRAVAAWGAVAAAGVALWDAL